MSISLEKGQRISLEKDGASLNEVCVGVNWGAIESKGFFGGKKLKAVDLDASVALFDDSKKLLDVVSFQQLKSKDGSIIHSGDDRTGDTSGDDGLDNEIITIKLSKVPANVKSIAVVLNSFTGIDFTDIPFASLRLYQGTPTRVDSIMAQYNLANDAQFKGKVTMVLGVLYRHNTAWKFKAIGESTNDKKLEATINTVAELYL